MPSKSHELVKNLSTAKRVYFIRCLECSFDLLTEFPVTKCLIIRKGIYLCKLFIYFLDFFLFSFFDSLLTSSDNDDVDVDVDVDIASDGKPNFPIKPSLIPISFEFIFFELPSSSISPIAVHLNSYICSKNPVPHNASFFGFIAFASLGSTVIAIVAAGSIRSDGNDRNDLRLVVVVVVVVLLVSR
jgi:hypothetical protein